MSEGAAATVLVVDDDRRVLGVVAEALAGSGYEVLTAATAGDAVRQAISSPAIDVLVCDVNVPGSGGRDLASQIGAGHPEARVVYMSGFPRDAVEQLGIVTGAATFLEKPLSLATLVETVERLVRQPSLQRTPPAYTRLVHLQRVACACMSSVTRN